MARSGASEAMAEAGYFGSVIQICRAKLKRRILESLQYGVHTSLKPVEAKRSISLRVDAEVLAWFQAQGPGYQTRMNAVLKAFKDASL